MRYLFSNFTFRRVVCTGEEYKPSCESLSSYIDTRSVRRNTTDSVEFICVSKTYDTNSAIAISFSEASLILLSSPCLVVALCLSLL